MAYVNSGAYKKIFPKNMSQLKNMSVEMKNLLSCMRQKRHSPLGNWVMCIHIGDMYMEHIGTTKQVLVEMVKLAK